MKELHLFYAPDIDTAHCLPDDEAGHAVRVLRMKEGDQLLATDGQGTFYDCTITLASHKKCILNIDNRRTVAPQWNGHIHLAVAPTKNMDRMEWLAEKATEIGLDAFSFVECQNSERRVLKPERIERIVVSATKQSHKARKPEVEELTRFKDFIKRPFDGQKFIAHCYDMPAISSDTEICTELPPSPFLADIVTPEDDAIILIGPEGDFSLEEVKQAVAAGFRPVSLGESRLRTETAALAAVHILNIAKSIKRSHTS